MLGLAASSSGLEFSELKLGAVSTQKLDLKDDEDDESDHDKNGKTSKKICDEQVLIFVLVQVSSIKNCKVFGCSAKLTRLQLRKE